MQVPVGVDVSELSQAVLRGDEIAEAALDSDGSPFGAEGVGIRDVEVHMGARTGRVVLLPFGEVKRDTSALDEAVTLSA